MPNLPFKQMGLPIALGAAALIGLKSYYVVEGGHQALTFNIFTGLSDRATGPGLHFLIPFIEKPIVYDIRKKPSELKAVSGSRDLQQVEMTLRILYGPGGNLSQLHRQLGPNYAERLLPSVAHETMRAVIAQYNVSELLQRRGQVSAGISEQLSSRCKDFNVDVEDVSIIHLVFGSEYSAAVERKQIAQQDAQKAEYLVEQAEQHKKSVILLAEGEAESAKLVGEAIRKNPGFLKLRRMEAAKEIAKDLSGSHSRAYLDSDALMLNLQDGGLLS
eukprot:TRINITY_DN113013_c0_g1_i1.p1 TRINITY_DN113013_c0_g1~~TRINITY_DN113013_c0_g1_i1.p1  ORF type:complete len:302 (-),score=23.85 TRINITY_DN113013_c0_g1_i1:78-899(-)